MKLSHYTVTHKGWALWAPVFIAEMPDNPKALVSVPRINWLGWIFDSAVWTMEVCNEIGFAFTTNWTGLDFWFVAELPKPFQVGVLEDKQ